MLAPSPVASLNHDLPFPGNPKSDSIRSDDALEQRCECRRYARPASAPLCPARKEGRKIICTGTEFKQQPVVRQDAIVRYLVEQIPREHFTKITE